MDIFLLAPCHCGDIRGGLVGGQDFQHCAEVIPHYPIYEGYVGSSKEVFQLLPLLILQPGKNDWRLSGEVDALSSPSNNEDSFFLHIRGGWVGTQTSTLTRQQCLPSLSCQVLKEVSQTESDAGNFNTLLSTIGKTMTQEISTGTGELNNTITNGIYSIFINTSPAKAEFIFFLSTHGTCVQMDYLLGRKAKLSKLKRIEIIQSRFAYYNGINPEINNRKIAAKSP